MGKQRESARPVAADGVKLGGDVNVVSLPGKAEDLAEAVPSPCDVRRVAELIFVARVTGHGCTSSTAEHHAKESIRLAELFAREFDGQSNQGT